MKNRVKRAKGVIGYRKIPAIYILPKPGEAASKKYFHTSLLIQKNG